MGNNIIASLLREKKQIELYANKFYGFVTQRPSRTIKTTAVLTALLFLPQIILTWRAYKRFQHIITSELKLQKLSDEFIYLDEVLTMSALMNATTGNRIWEKRYREYEKKLEVVVKKSKKLAPDLYSSKVGKKNDAAIQELVELEYQSFELVKNGQKEAAYNILLGKKYKNEKEKHTKFLAQINKSIYEQVNDKISKYRQQLLFTSSLAILSLILLISAWLIVLRLLNEYLEQRQLAQAELQKTNQELEMRVEKRTAELSDKNQQLVETLQELQDTQIQLIHTEKMSGLGQLVGGVAHEINNPVTFIDGNLTHAKQYTQDLLNLIQLYQFHFPETPEEIEEEIEAVELDFLKEDVFKIHESMKTGTQRIRDIVLSLRNFSRLDEADFKQVDIHEGIDSTLLILQNRLKLKPDGEILIIKEYKQMTLVECYPSQLNQAIMNILSNAIDSLETNIKNKNQTLNPEIRITTELSDNNHVTIRIADNGCGMTEEVHSKLFDPFFTTKPVGEGTGLGLSIAYKIIVTKHNGKLSCNSELGKGAEFIIEIPVNS
ncbi:two-component sensor histidine kinase [Calothrix parasitica NIES-267]|uniref:histidine kinase n=1 Tax=Calothrix parasitica NIES-267 TaxID=1973488 RepID=A0A1Z4LM16_9CYAN|nr:two-component sensor histidine kinase [Calothrix parasitica NIES-267]